MKQTIDYSKLEGQEKHDKAIADCKWYLGDESYEKVINSIMDYINEDEDGDNKHLREMVINSMAMFLPISGYPLQAMYDEAVKRHKELCNG